MAAVIVGLGGCGGSSSHPLTISAYTVRGDEEPGYPAQSPVDQKSVQALALEQTFTAADERRLTAEGFKASAVEQTGSTQPGLSFVIELGSTAAAQQELLSQVGQDLRGRHAVRFSDVALPAAVGVAYPRHHGGAGNVLFVEGRCMLLVGDEDNSTGAYFQPAIAGANAIWKRTQGRPGACST